NSLVFVSHLHGVWAGPENSRKLSKRYGRLIRSPNRGLNEMLNAHKEDVFKFMEERVEEEAEEGGEGVKEQGEGLGEGLGEGGKGA
ncbi:histone deacetylase 6/10, partial [Blastomyces dermatitidis ATCC 26199]